MPPHCCVCAAQAEREIASRLNSPGNPQHCARKPCPRANLAPAHCEFWLRAQVRSLTCPICPGPGRNLSTCGAWRRKAQGQEHLRCDVINFRRQQGLRRLSTRGVRKKAVASPASGGGSAGSCLPGVARVPWCRRQCFLTRRKHRPRLVLPRLVW